MRASVDPTPRDFPSTPTPNPALTSTLALTLTLTLAIGNPNAPYYWNRNRMSSTDSRAREALSDPTVPSKTRRFLSWSFTMRSSMVSSMMKRVAKMGLCWPMRCVRSMACSSAAGFHQGSMMKTWLALTRLSATPPALRLMRSTLQSGSSRNLSSTCLRWETLRCPESTTTPMCSSRRRYSHRSRKFTYCENTSALPVESCSSISRRACTSASIFVEVWKFLRSTLCMMLFLRRPFTPGLGAAAAAGGLSGSSRAGACLQLGFGGG
mmetsp:Transcript_1763/g.5012  ORF Transcript_1763/g.5012 Transcript_1763/m.5012 type:complete len:266 (+) Transcript_1763:139-936(+)